MTYYLKNTSGSLVNVIDLGISLPNNQSLVIDSNGINAYLTTDLTAAITAGNLILSTTDIGDNGGDMSIADAIAALSITSRFDRDNPHNVTITQTLAADTNTDITLSELNELTSGNGTTLHHHDSRYYTETELGTSNAGTVSIHWDNIIHAPQFGALEWQSPALGNLVGKGAYSAIPATAEEGQFYLSTDNDHLYRYTSGVWTDQGSPTTGTRVIFKDGTGSDDRIYEWDGDSWDPDPAPQDNWAVVVSDDGDGKSAQYVYDSSGLPPDWIKIADVDWGSHDALADRDSANSHPATAISFNNTTSGLAATTVQAAIDEIATEQGVDLNNIVFVAKNGIDTNPNVTLGTIANPYLTVQAAIDSITSASSTNRYVVYVMPGDYNENVVLNKPFVYLASPQKNAARIISSSGTTLSVGSTTEKSNGVYNLSLVSTSSMTTDAALTITGNNPTIFNVDILATSGARTAFINGAFSQTFRHVNLRGGTFRIDAGVVEFYDSKVVEAVTDITSGTLRVHNGDFSHNGGDAISQSAGTVYLVSAALSSGTGAKDYNQSGGTVYWGWVEYNQTKVTFNGTKTLLFPANDLYYNSTGDVNITGDDIDEVISQIDNIITNILDGLSDHEGRTDNPHTVTFTQASLADPNTDITAAEAETLTNASNADLLHTHAASNISYNNSGTSLSSTTVQDAITELSNEVGTEIQNVVYVAKNGTDTNPNVTLGTLDNPYLTVQAALNSITDASSTKYYVVFVMPGTYLEDLTLKPWIGIIGLSKETTKVRTETGDHIANFTSGGRWFAKNIGFGGTQDMIFTHPAASSGGTSIWFDNCQIGTLTANMLGGGVDYVQLRNDVSITGATAIHAANLTAYNSVFMGGLTIDDTGVEHLDSYGSASSNTVKDCMGGNLLLKGASQNVWVEFYNNYSWSTLTSDGNADVHVDAQSAPDVRASMVSVNGGRFHLTDNAFAVGYDDTLTSLNANNVQDAIQALNSKITQFDMPSGTSFPTSPAPSAGDIFYRTDLNMTFQYDSSRSKWLSMSQMFLDWGSNVADGKYLNIHGAVATQTGYLMPYNGTIISVTAKSASGNQSKLFELRRNNDRVTPLDSFTLTSGSYSAINKNIDFDAGDYLQAFVPASGVPAKDAVVMVVICWRE